MMPFYYKGYNFLSTYIHILPRLYSLQHHQQYNYSMCYYMYIYQPRKHHNDSCVKMENCMLYPNKSNGYSML